MLNMAFEPYAVIRQEFNSGSFKRVLYACDIVRYRDTSPSLKIRNRLSGDVRSLG